MEQRANLKETQPEAWKALYHLGVVLSKGSLTPIQRHLIKIRASQLNSCAYCIDMHTKEALKIGETPQRIFLLNAWKETDFFTEEEKAILALTEEVTPVHNHGVSNETFREAEKYFSAEVIGEIIMSIVLMNAWNRVAVSSRLPIVN